MKANILEQKSFKPFTIELEVETENEARFFAYVSSNPNAVSHFVNDNLVLVGHIKVRPLSLVPLSRVLTSELDRQGIEK